MAEYDDTNRGAAFTPFPTQKMILQGKVNIEGNDNKVVLVSDETRDGRKIIEVFQKVGVLFENDKKGNEAAPDYSGPIRQAIDSYTMGASGKSPLEKRIAGWRRMKDGKPYMSFNVSDKQGGTEERNIPDPSKALPDDDIPF